MKSDPGMEVYLPSPLPSVAAISPSTPAAEVIDNNTNNSSGNNNNRDASKPTENGQTNTLDVDGSITARSGETTDNERPQDDYRTDSATAYSSPRSATVDVDTTKVHVKSSDLEARVIGSGPEVVRDSVGLEHVSNLEILNSASQPPAWWNKKRWFALGCAIVLLLVIAIIVVGLVAGLVLARRSGSGTEADTSSVAALSACGTHPKPIRRQLLAAVQHKGDVYLFARAQDLSIRYRVLSGSDSTWKGPWENWVATGDTFVGPPTAVAWKPWEDDRLHVFAPANNDKYNVLAAGFMNGSHPATWENLGESTATPVSLCLIPKGFVSSAAGSPERIDQWVVNRTTKMIAHNFWNSAIENFQEPATYADWEVSPSVQASASTLAMVCRKNDPIHTVVMYASGTDSVRFRHYTAENRLWNSWVDIGGDFVGDPVLLQTTDMSFQFFGINSTGMMQNFIWTNVTGVGYRPPWVHLGGNFSSMPSAVVSDDANPNALELDVVALGTDGNLKHKAFRNESWARQWEDLNVTASSAPLLFKYATQAGVNRTLLAAIGEDNQLRVATWETKSQNLKPWRELVGASWANVGGDLSLKSMCD